MSGPKGHAWPTDVPTARALARAGGRGSVARTLNDDLRHVIAVDLGYGDAGKGTVVDHLAAEGGTLPGWSRRTGRPVTVIRFNGGAQAAHNVVAPLTPGGPVVHHTFSQFGAGTLTPGVRTHLSSFMLLQPLALLNEASALAALGVPDPLRRLTIDERALVTTPAHRALNQARELARDATGQARHGSCGIGVGETMSIALADGVALRAGDLRSPAATLRVLRSLDELARPRIAAALGREAGPVLAALPSPEAVATLFTAVAARLRIVGADHLRALLTAGSCLFEGAQGVLLDEWWGLHPHTTWSTTTADNAEELLAEAGMGGTALRLGIVRALTTRHGAGPHPTADPRLSDLAPEPHNPENAWQHGFRVGHLDLVAHAYAVAATGGVDALAVTHLDTAARLHGRLRVATAYDVDGLDGGRRRLTALPLGVPGDLAHTAALGELLAGARPRYAVLPTDPRALIAAALGAPVVLGSHGPARGDKQTYTAGDSGRIAA